VPDTPIQEMLRAVDALDLDGVVALFTAGASLTTAFGDATEGRDRVRDVLGDFLHELRATHHEITHEWHPEDEVWIAEMSATYELSDYSRRGPYQRAIFLRTGDGGIEEMRIYGAHELRLPGAGRQYTEVRAPGGWLPTL
jgi:ketosteroid isomerase-like protein